MSRYRKQTLFAPIGEAGQARLARSHVAVVGCGALGSASSEQLARAGVGRLTLVDRDFVELSNLQRQTLYTEADAAARTPKAVAAAARLAAVNSDVEITREVADLTPESIDRLLGGADLVLDGLDNFESRFLLNDWAAETATPWIYTGCVGSGGQVLLVRPGRSACLACVVPEPPAPGESETCDTTGVIGPAVQTVVGLQAALALRFLATGDAPASLFAVDVWPPSLREISTEGLRDRSGCPTCHHGRRDWLRSERGSRTAILCGRNAVQVTPENAATSLDEVADRIGADHPVERTPFLLRVQLSAGDPPLTATLFRDGRAIIQGTEDPAAARMAYNRLVGT